MLLVALFSSLIPMTLNNSSSECLLASSTNTLLFVLLGRTSVAC